VPTTFGSGAADTLRSFGLLPAAHGAQETVAQICIAPVRLAPVTGSGGYLLGCDAAEDLWFERCGTCFARV
jgi:hypothetical protein